MILTFNYSEQGVKDPRPVLVSLKETYYRLQIANPKKRSAMTPKRFYSDVVSSDKYFKESYRSYKLSKLTSLKVTQINMEFIQ